MNYNTLTQLPQIRILGRTNIKDGAAVIYWGCSGLEMNYKGNRLELDVEADFDNFEPWLTVELNGAFIIRQPLAKGRYKLQILNTFNKDVVKHIRIFKDCQPMPDDAKHSIIIHGVSYDGSFEPLDEPKYRFEFLGDSITTGEGAIGAQCDMDYNTTFCCASNTYERITSDAFGAEFCVVSQAGWGIVTGWDNNHECNIPRIYKEVCGASSCKKLIDLGAYDPYDFKSFNTDVVVINLGTNDLVAFDQPAFKDPKTGNTYENRKNEDGSFNKDDLNEFENACEAFLKTVRECNPNAKIVWCYGMLGFGLFDNIKKVVEKRKADGDKEIYTLELINTTPDLYGACMHPGPQSHKNSAKVLTEFLKTILK